MTIQLANTSDHELLTQITKKSKAYWGYSEDLFLDWDDALTITQEYISTHPVYTFAVDDKIVGYYSYILEDEHNIKLDNLFLLPQYIGKGLGSYLITDILNRIQTQNYKRVYLAVYYTHLYVYKRQLSWLLLRWLYRPFYRFALELLQ